MRKSSVSRLISFIITEELPLQALEIGQEYFFIDWYGVSPNGVPAKISYLAPEMVEFQVEGLYENQTTPITKQFSKSDYSTGWKLSRSNKGLAAQTLGLYESLKLLFPAGLIIFLEEDLNRLFGADCLRSFTHNPMFTNFFHVEWGQDVNTTLLSVSSYYPVYSLLKSSMYKPVVKPTLRVIRGGLESRREESLLR